MPHRCPVEGSYGSMFQPGYPTNKFNPSLLMVNLWLRPGLKVSSQALALAGGKSYVKKLLKALINP